MTAKQLREERAKLHKEMVAVVAKAKEENRAELTAEERAELDRKSAAIDSMKEKIDDLERIEKVSALDGELAQMREAREFGEKKVGITRRDYELAYQGWALGSRADRKHAEAGQKIGFDIKRNELPLQLLPVAPKSLGELREVAEQFRESAKMVRSTTKINVVGDTTLGGNVVQNEAMIALEKALLLYGGIRRAARVVRTQTGASLPWPCVDDTASAAALIGESTELDVLAVDFKTVTLASYAFTSRFIKLSFQLLQDAAFPVPSMIGELIGERFARGTNAYFTTGTGSSQPKGAVTCSVLGRTATDVHVLSYTDLLTLFHSVNPAYRTSPSCYFMFGDVTLKSIKAIVDGQSRPLWAPGIVNGEPDTLLGKPYIINPDMATVAAASTGPGAAKAILFGDFNTFVVRDAMDVAIQRADELFLGNGQVGFVGLSRHDSNMVSSSTVALTHLITKAT